MALSSDTDLATRTKIIMSLLLSGANTEFRDINMKTPLFLAVEKSEFSLVQILVDRGANVKARSDHNRTLLHHSRDSRIFAYLTRLGLDLHERDSFGLSVIDYSMSSPFRRRLIMSSDLDSIPPIRWTALSSFDAMLIFAQLPKINRRFLKPGQPPIIDLHPSQTISPLCAAASYGDATTLEGLLSMGAEIEFEGCEHGTALMAACSTGDMDAVKFLVRRGARVFYTSEQGFRSAIIAGSRYPAVVSWILTSRFIDQPKIESIYDDEERRSHNISLWSGIRQAIYYPTRSQRRTFRGRGVDSASWAEGWRKRYAGEVVSGAILSL
jgi:hypothetical protein